MLGKTVSHYQILEKLGEGGMGAVYLAEDTKLQRKVALKFLPIELTKDESRRQRFMQEARAAAAMEHPNIAAIYDIDEVDGHTFIAMEYVRGESLRDAIRDGKLRLRKSLELAHQIAEGLAKAHERGVVHRDLKPENVLLSEDGYAKIIDFGLAKLGEPVPSPDGNTVEHEAETLVRTQDGLVLGTVAYMSPEQARAKAVDARTDVFSFGVVFHEMLAGEPPFKRASVAETLSAILKESPAPLPDDITSLVPELPRILRTSLSKEPDSRYQRMRDVAQELREVRDRLGSGTRPAFALRLPKEIRAAFVAVSAIVLATLSIYFVSRSSEPTGIGASGRPAIAVMYFEDNTGSEEIRWLSKGLPNMLLTDLARTPGLDVVSRQRIQELLMQVGEEQLGALDASLVPEIARRAGAGAVVSGSIYKLGDEIRIDVQVEDVGSGRILSAHSVRGDDVFPLVDELTGRIRASLNMTDAPLERGIAEVTTASLEAYRLYTEGREAIRLFRWADAREHLEKAIQIDPQFALGYFELSNISGLWADDSVQEGYRAKVREHVDRLPERRRLLIEATYAWQSEQDPEKARIFWRTLSPVIPTRKMPISLFPSFTRVRSISRKRLWRPYRRERRMYRAPERFTINTGTTCSTRAAIQKPSESWKRTPRSTPKSPTPSTAWAKRIFLPPSRRSRSTTTSELSRSTPRSSTPIAAGLGASRCWVATMRPSMKWPRYKRRSTRRAFRT